MRRQTLVNALLIIAGIVLAFALFAAGVLWHSRVDLETDQFRISERRTKPMHPTSATITLQNYFLRTMIFAVSAVALLMATAGTAAACGPNGRAHA